MLLTRVLSAVLLIPIVLVILYLDGWALLGLVVTVTAIGCYEFYSLFARAGQRPLSLPGTLAAVLIVIASYFSRDDLLAAVAAAAILGTLALALFQFRVLPAVAADWMLTLSGVLYVGWLLRYAVLLRNLHNGWEWSLLALLTTWAADTGAFLVGSYLGRHKFSPRISPGKTWEGVAGGLVFTVIVAIIAGQWLLSLPTWLGLLLGIIVAVASIAGDLAESLFKRAAGAKDSGALIPGHGGLLDRMDSLLFVLPAVYYFAIWAVR